ncbi:glycosyltransferase [bacterium]|nr:glycosyltransferase [bacterium]
MPFRPEDKPRVSIITIMYNGRTELLKRAVQSVINQSYPYWELILQDDHSTDGTYEMAVGLAMTDKRIKVYRNKKNLGISKNRLEAFKNTTGDLIAHLDNDDFLYPDAVKLMVDAFERNSEIGFAYSDMAYIEDNLPSGYIAHKNYGEPLSQYGWRHFGMFRRSAYDKTSGYNVDLAYPCEDADIFMQIAEKFVFARVPFVLYGYHNQGEHAYTGIGPCNTCPTRHICNFSRVFAKSLTPPIDVLSWKPIEE